MKPDTSSERAFRRRLALLSLLHTRPRPYSELMAALDQQQLLDYDRFANTEVIAQQQKEQFRRDCKALRAAGCKLKHNRPTDCYVWHNSPFGLGLSASQLAALALLRHTFTETTILHSAEVQDLLNHLTAQLPPEQRQILAALRQPFSINLRETTDYRQADPATVSEIEKAIRNGQQLEFRYIPPRDGKERQHCIEPRPLVFEQGHVYLKGWSVTWDKEMPFRLDKIVPGSARMLPTRIAAIRPAGVTYQLRYWLSPVIARQGVSQHFTDQQVECHPDGSATVTATLCSNELFEARRRLLSYGQHCRVLEPPELVAQLREIATTLYQFYCTEG
jgi:predicted DNA-binding transcriptional regulator YafY